tara:strand:+ start:165 stop:389 length:225 start_codon:yes stop_codon:yes gene_type:complete
MKKYSKRYYLSLPYKEKLEVLKNALRIDFSFYLVVCGYYLEASIGEGGLPNNTIEREFEKGLKRNYYFKKNINE